MIAAAAVLLWVGLIITTPLFLANGLSSISSPLYSFFGYICHQIPERSLHLAAHQMAVCTRCFGVYAGLAAGLLVYPLWRTLDEVEAIPRVWLFLSLVPVGIDWTLTIFGIWENTHFSRFVTGGILGAVCATYMVPALVEITRNISSQKPKPQ